MSRYQDAVDTLYQAPLASFVAERKRLAGELKPTDKAAAARLAKLARPTQSAWAVNQLHWRARRELDALFATATKLRAGKLEATAEHRASIATLRGRAAAILVEAGHAAPESTLRRITTTLAALAATGSWAPAEPGTLATDLDPPGFEAAGIPTHAPADAVDRPADELAAKRAANAKHSDARHADARHAEAKHVDARNAEATHADARNVAATRAAEAAARRAAEEAAAREREAAAADRRRIEAERARRVADRRRIEDALRAATTDVQRREREVARVVTALADAEAAAESARAVQHDLESQLASITAADRADA